MEADEKFAKKIDELVISAKDDPELMGGIKWVDLEARKKNITFYDMVLQVLKVKKINSDIRNLFMDSMH